MEQSGDEMRFYMFPIASSAFVGPEGQMNTVMQLQTDGTFLSEMGGSGPGSARNLGDGRPAALDYRRGTLRLFRRLER